MDLKYEEKHPQHSMNWVHVHRIIYTVEWKKFAQDKLQKLWQQGTLQEHITSFDSIVVVLPDLAMDDAIHAFVFGSKPYLKGFVKVLIQVKTDASLNVVMIVILKLEENV